MDDANTQSIASNVIAKRGHSRGPARQEWLVTYSDMITLLFTFVLIILKVSDIDINRFDELREGLSETFLRQDVSTAFKSLSEDIIKIKDKYNDIQVEANNREIIITLESVDYYELGSADIAKEALFRIDEVVSTIHVSPYKAFFLEVEGHTDDLPINTRQFPSNWELSTARATNIVKYMTVQGIPPDRIRAVGYAESQPVLESLTPDGNINPDKRSLNRRIVIKVRPRI